ncbi:MAG: hypothetical protein ACRETB_12375 [Steroidobacteraceae bacterium]
MPGAGHERAAAIEAAADLLALAMHESHEPVEVLGGALERMALALTECGRVIERWRARGAVRPDEPAAVPFAELDPYCRALEADIALCIESLQFHDRMMQRLTHVVDHLAGRAAEAHGHGDLRRVNLNEGSIELF